MTAPGLLTADCGNTTVDCLRHGDGTRARADASDPALAALRPLFTGIDRCVAVSVAPAALQRLRGVLRERDIALQIAGVDLPCPLRLDYETPATLGADRWVGALAAHRAFGRAIVVDCGSATTVNLVDADGTFRGGAIAPGLRAFVAGMAAATPALPAADLDAAPELPPRSTHTAVATGVVLGYCGLVERLVAAMLAVSRGSTHVVLTGGNAERLQRHARLRAEFVPDLVHRGLRALAEAATWKR
jgi:pantothenate kinase type III